jgi:hypothetical protein
MGVQDDQLPTVPGFPAGINNTAALTRAPRDQNGAVVAAREAFDLDFDATGAARMRRGRTTVHDTPTHSLFPTDDHLLAVVGADLKAYTDPGTGLVEAATVIAGIGPRFVSYATDDYDTLWANGVATGRIAADLTTGPLWLDTPDPVGLATSSAGGLAAGSYEVSVTAIDADGRESGASDPAVIAVTAGQGITVTLPAAPAGAVTWRIYRTAADGDALNLAGTAPEGTASVELAHDQLGAKLETAWLFPMLACDVIRYGHGRLLGLRSDGLLWSVPYRLGLMHAENAIGLKGGTLLEPVGEGAGGAGWYVADFKRTYFMAGADPAAWQQVVRVPHPAVPGTSITVPGSVFGLETPEPVAFWLGRNGTFYIGLPGGVVKPVREQELAVHVDAERGASGYFSHAGIRQILTSLLAAASNGAAVGDDASVTVRRHGIEL